MLPAGLLAEVLESLLIPYPLHNACSPTCQTSRTGLAHSRVISLATAGEPLAAAMIELQQCQSRPVLSGLFQQALSGWCEVQRC